MKFTIPITISLAIALFIFPTLSFASAIEPLGASGHIFENNNVAYGMRTGITGEARVINSRTVLVESNGITKAEMIVITTNKHGLSKNILQAISTNEIHVEGRAQVLSIEQLEQRSGIDLDNSTLKRYEGKTVVVAETIDLK